MINMNHPDRGDRIELLEDELLPEKPKKTPKPKPVLTLEGAIQLATAAHAGQVDKAGEPYINHPLAVMRRAKDSGLDEDLQIVAVLHDVVEDSDHTLKTLRKAGANGRVIRVIQVLTHVEGESNEQYWETISLSHDAVVLKDCDLDENTDPTRLAALDPATRERLITKYTRAREVIHAYYR